MQYDKSRFKIQAFPHPLILFYVLCPIFILNELIFGQRLPKVTLIDKESDKPLGERTYIPCPHCETLNDNRLWAKGNAFGHWFGLVCPSCHQVIPCLWNVFSLAILAITFLLWYFPARFFRRRWLEKEKKRLAKVLERPLIQAKSIHSMGWIGTFVLGVSMVVMFVISEAVLDVWRGKEWDLKTMLESLPMWMSVGFASICFPRWVEKETEKEKERLANRERPLIRPTFINWVSTGNLNLFLKGTFYFGGGMWVAFGVWQVLKEREWDLRAMFDMLPFWLLAGFVLGCFMHVWMNLDLMNPKRRKP